MALFACTGNCNVWYNTHVALKLSLTIKTFLEGTSKDAPWVSYNPEFDVASCGATSRESEKNLKEAVEIVLEGAKEDGNLEKLLGESGFSLKESKVVPPKVTFGQVSLTI